MGEKPGRILQAASMCPIHQADAREGMSGEMLLAPAPLGTSILGANEGAKTGREGQEEGKVMLKIIAKEIHQNALEHGWYDEPRSFGEVVALCHSELSEALEEYRRDKPMVYGEDKPEGVAVEMADCLIRILDWFGDTGLDVDDIVYRKHSYNRSRPYRHGGKKL